MKLLADLDMAELLVHRNGETSWILLIFGEAGWDMVADYSEDLSYIVDSIIDPYLPWNKADAGPHDRAYSVFTLPSPEELEKGDPNKAAEAIDTLLQIERAL